MLTRTVSKDMVKRAMEHGFIDRLTGCSNCNGTGKFDHLSGEGFIVNCIYNDPADPPHRYCTCETCKGSGIEPEVEDSVRDFLETVVNGESS